MNDQVTKVISSTTSAESTELGDFQALVRTGGATFFADEPTQFGGLGTGPSPYDLLCAALATCSAMTLRVYAQMKHLPLEHVRVEVTHEKDSKLAIPDQFHRVIYLKGPLDEPVKARLLEIAERCPVRRTLTTGARVETTLAQ